MRYETQCMQLYGKIDTGFDVVPGRKDCITYYKLSAICVRVSEDPWRFNETITGCYGPGNSPGSYDKIYLTENA